MQPHPSRARGRLFLAGAATGLAGVATSEVARAVLRREAGPVVAVAEAVRDRTPGGLAASLVHLVRHLDKPLLVLGTTVVLVALCGLAGVLSGRRPWAGYLVLAALAGVGLWAVLGRDGSGQFDLVPLVVGAGTWLLVLPWLTGAARGTAPDSNTGSERGAESARGRRAFLLQIAGTGAVALVGIGAARLLGAGRTKVEQARQALRLRVGRGDVPAGNGHDPRVPWRTPNAGFYQIDTALTIPTIAPTDWRLRVHGMVDRPFEIGYEELVRIGLEERWITLCCVSNDIGGDLISNAHWSGVPVRTLLARAGVRSGADAVKQTSQDGWTCGTPLTALTDPGREALLAVAMNGDPLPLEHGFPVRMVVPGLYGYVSATKWVVDLEVTRFADFSAYWTQRGWGEKGPVKTGSRIDLPASGSTVDAGAVRLAGYAWAQHTGIERVEVQVDRGDWLAADLGGVPNDDTWVQWRATATVPKGRHTARVRATDKTGATQTSARADVLPDGATGWHTIGFDVG